MGKINDKPLISIVMATYNGAIYLREQLDSVVNQTYRNLEILIQDDGSSDGTLDILKEYSSKDDRIKYSANEVNLGLIDNFYSLIQKCGGEFIAISDQDDVWDLDKISLLFEGIGNHSLIYTDSVLIDHEGNEMGRTILEELKKVPKEGRNLTKLFTENTISGHACMFSSVLKIYLPVSSSSSQIHKSSEESSIPLMYDMVIGFVASVMNGVVYYDKPLTYHRMHPTNNHNTFTQDKEKGAGAGAGDAERIKKSFFERKKKRLANKVGFQRTKLIALRLFSEISNSFSEDVIKKSPLVGLTVTEFKVFEETFERTIFNRKLYKLLLSSGFTKSDARDASLGKYYFYLFELF